MKWARISASRPMESRQQSARGSPWTSNVSGFQGYIHIGDQQSRYTSVSLRVRSSSRVYIHAFFLKKKGKKVRLFVWCLLFIFFFLLNEKKERKIFPLLEIRGSSMEKKEKRKWEVSVIDERREMEMELEMWRDRRAFRNGFVFDNFSCFGLLLKFFFIIFRGEGKIRFSPCAKMIRVQMIWIRLHVCRVIFIRFD